MYNSRFVFEDGTFVYPRYFSREQREELRNKIGSSREVMWCGCRADQRLFYRISADLRFIPEHNGYKHASYCVRFHEDDADARRSSAFLPDDTSEKAFVYLKFNPHKFTIPKMKDLGNDSAADSEEEQEEQEDTEEISSSNMNEKELLSIPKVKKNDEYKEPFLDLASFVRCLNVDTFTDRVLSGKSILTKDYFSSALYGRMKNIYIKGTHKSVRELNLMSDHVRFFYAPFIKGELVEKDGYSTCHVIVQGKDQEYSMFVFSKTYETALHHFKQQYGIEPNENTMAAGFQYLKKSKKGRDYKVVGRLHLFLVSNNGIYSHTIQEANTYDTILKALWNRKDIRLLLPTDDELITGIFEKSGTLRKGAIILPTKSQTELLELDEEQYEVLILDNNEELTPSAFKHFLDRI